MLDSFHSQDRQFIGRIGEKEWGNYKRFAFRDDMMKLTVGLVLGNAFNKVIQSLSSNIAMPALSFVALNAGEAWRDWAWRPLPGLEIRVGQVAGDAFDFFVVSVVLYLVYVKLAGRSYEAGLGPPPCAKRCVLCLECVHPGAVRCKFCGGDPNVVERGDGVEDKGAKRGRGKQERPHGTKRKDSDGAEDAREPDSRAGSGRRVPRPRRKGR